MTYTDPEPLVIPPGMQPEPTAKGAINDFPVVEVAAGVGGLALLTIILRSL